MKLLPKIVQKSWDYGAGRMAVAAFCAHSVSISIGISQGYSAILIPQLNATSAISVDAEESSWLASLGAVSNPVGSILSGLVAEYFGRKRSIQLSSVPFLIGWLCIGLANNIELLYTGRLISGIAGGMSTACYTYVSEISDPGHRGILQALGPICASFGILLTYVLGYYVRWSTVAFASVAFAVFTLVAVEFVPESPEYLAKVGATQRSFDSLLWFRRNPAAARRESEMGAQKAALAERSTREAYLSPATIKPFLILVGLFFLQELSGIYTVLFYAVSFFEETGLEVDSYVASILVGFIRFAMSIVTAVLLNRFGRRSLCMVSSAGMAAAMLAMVVFFKYYEVHAGESRVFPSLPLVCVLVNVLFSMVGMLPIPWILVGELFPLQVRSIMGGVVICIAQCFIFICVKIYPDMIAKLDFSGTLSSFFVAAVLALLFCKFLLPETKDKSLREIEEYFRDAPAIEATGYDNKGFVLKPEVGEIFTVQVH